MAASKNAAVPKKDTAKVFMSGRSQAVRLPKKYRFAEGCDEVSVHKEGDSIVLTPRHVTWEEFWAGATPLDDEVVEAALSCGDGLVDDPERASFDE